MQSTNDPFDPCALPSLRDERSEGRRAEIVAAARSLFEEKGLSRTSVQDIAARVGMSRTLFYRYFRNKADVTSAVLDTYVEDFVETVRLWDGERVPGDVESALDSAIRLFRMALFEGNPFHLSIASHENAELYLEFTSRVAERVAAYIEAHTAKDYGSRHDIRIRHLHEALCVLIIGMGGYLRLHPDVDDGLLKDLVAQTLHMDR